MAVIAFDLKKHVPATVSCRTPKFNERDRRRVLVPLTFGRFDGDDIFVDDSKGVSPRFKGLWI